MMIATVLLALTGAIQLPQAVSQCSNQITGFTLIDADLDLEIGPLPRVLDYTLLPTKNLNVRADYISCPDVPIDSVYTDYESRQNSSLQLCERYTPYSVFRDNNPGGPDLGRMGQFDPFTFPVGSGQSIKATPYTSRACSGTKGLSLTVNFDVINTVPCPGQALSLVLWDADNKRPELQLVDGAKFCPTTQNYNMEARTADCRGGSTGSVYLTLIRENRPSDGNLSLTSAIVNEAPYFLFGNVSNVTQNGTIPGGGVLANGFYTLTATPYTEPNGLGQRGQSLTVQFEIDCLCTHQVTGFTLIDADLDVALGPLPAVIDYGNLPTDQLNVQVDVKSCPGGKCVDSVSVKYQKDGRSCYDSCDSWTPYAVFGDTNRWGPDLGDSGNFLPYTFPSGPANQTISAMPFTGHRCQGTPGQAKQVQLEVKNSVACPGRVASFVWWDAHRVKPLFTIQPGSVFCPYSNSTTASRTTYFNIQARVIPCETAVIGGFLRQSHPIASVKFRLDRLNAPNTNSSNDLATVLVSHTDNLAPFKLYGILSPMGIMGQDGSILGGNSGVEQQVDGIRTPLPDGTYQLTALPFARVGGLGSSGTPMSVTFTVNCE